MRHYHNLPEFMETKRAVYDRNHMKTMHYLPELDSNVADFSKAEFWDEGDDLFGNEYHIVRYLCSDGVTRSCLLYNPPEISPEDFMEYQAASCGLTEADFIGYY